MKTTTLKIAVLLTIAACAAAAAPDAPSTSQPGPLKFYGTISAVDAKAMTFTIDNQTYSVIAESQMTKASDNSKATLADAVVGETARGSYTKSADGKLNVTKVRFGKKTGGGKSGKKKSDAAKSDAAATQPKDTQPKE